MAGRKDRILVCVVDGLTNKQASSLMGEFTKAKNNIAPLSRGTAAVTERGRIGSILQKKMKAIKSN